MTDSWGAAIRSCLGNSLSNRFKAFLAGLGATILLQSSSATALLTASFSGQGLFNTTTALAILLGADVGTTIVAQILTFDLAFLSPVLISLGVILSGYRTAEKMRSIGRILFGLGMMLLALKLILAASIPMSESVLIAKVFATLNSDLAFAVVLGALITWVAHSSLATVLLIVSLVTAGVISGLPAFALVLGANLGGAIPPVIATLGSSPETRRPPLGNLLFRLIGVVLVLVLVDFAAPYFYLLSKEPARQVVNFHTLFNIALAIIFIPFIGAMSQFTTRIIADNSVRKENQGPLYLERSALDSAPVALSNATRETLRMGDVVQKMLSDSYVALTTNDKELAINARERDSVVNQYYDQIKQYLTELNREQPGDKESKKCTDIITFVTNLEHIGDIVSGDLVDGIIRKKVDQNLELSAHDRQTLDSLYQPVLDNFKLSLGVFMNGDLAMAKQLMARKYELIELERTAVVAHLDDLKNNQGYHPELSSLQLDIYRDLRRINTHLATVAYTHLDEAGQLRKTRLKKKRQSQQ